MQGGDFDVPSVPYSFDFLLSKWIEINLWKKRSIARVKSKGQMHISFGYYRVLLSETNILFPQTVSGILQHHDQIL